MLLKIIFIFMVFFSIPAFAEIINIQPQGVYAEIKDNSKEDFRLLHIFKGGNEQEKAEAARKIESNLGGHSPPVILLLGTYYMLQRKFEKALIYHEFAIFRTQIDIASSHDITLTDVVPFFMMSVVNNMRTLSKNDQQEYVAISKLGVSGQPSIARKVMSLDESTPRNYEARWASLHGMDCIRNMPIRYASKKEIDKIIQEKRELYIKAAKDAGAW